MLRIPVGLHSHRPATAMAIERVSAALTARLPPSYVQFLETTDGLHTDLGVVLYSTEDLVERNQTFEVHRYLPRYVAVGDDSGDRLLVMDRDTPRVYLVDQGSLAEQSLSLLAPELASWVEAGCVLELDEDDQALDGSRRVDVVMVAAPANNGVLQLIRRELNLAVGLVELKAMIQHLPVTLLNGVPYGKYRIRCRRINQVGECLALMDPSGQLLPA